MFDRLDGGLTRKAFKEYLRSSFRHDVRAILRGQQREGSRRRFGEGTLRAAAWAVLRLRLPETWSLAAECAYPKNWGKRDDRPDILVLPPKRNGGPIPFELKRERAGTDKDVAKIRWLLKMKMDPVKWGVVVFGAYSEATFDVPSSRRFKGGEVTVVAIDFFSDEGAAAEARAAVGESQPSPTTRRAAEPRSVTSTLDLDRKWRDRAVSWPYGRDALIWTEDSGLNWWRDPSRDVTAQTRLRHFTAGGFKVVGRFSPPELPDAKAPPLK